MEDTGSGVPEEELQLIFEPFYRTQGNSQPGNGLGLAISLEIARNLGGHITLLNRENGGLQFQYLQSQNISQNLSTRPLSSAVNNLN